jgi:hypothetical protein
VTKTGKSTSETNFRRSFNAEFAEPSASDLGSVEIHLEWIMAAAR